MLTLAIMTNNAEVYETLQRQSTEFGVLMR